MGDKSPKDKMKKKQQHDREVQQKNQHKQENMSKNRHAADAPNGQPAAQEYKKAG